MRWIVTIIFLIAFNGFALLVVSSVVDLNGESNESCLPRVSQGHQY